MPSNARLGYANLLESGTVVASSENAAFPVANLYDWLTCDFFKPAASGTINITLTLPSPATADYFAFYNHDLPAASGTIRLQYWTGSAWANCFSAVTPTDNAPRLITFTSRTSNQWRIVITASSVFSLACVSFGPSLMLENGMYMGWTPPKLGRATRLVNSVSDGGAFLGRSLIANGVRSALDIRYASDAWMRTSWLAFVKHAERKPFFFAPDIVGQPNEAVFAYADGDIPTPSHNAYGFMGVSMPIAGMVE